MTNISGPRRRTFLVAIVVLLAVMQASIGCTDATNDSVPQAKTGEVLVDQLVDSYNAKSLGQSLKVLCGQAQGEYVQLGLEGFTELSKTTVTTNGYVTAAPVGMTIVRRTKTQRTANILVGYSKNQLKFQLTISFRVDNGECIDGVVRNLDDGTPKPLGSELRFVTGPKAFSPSPTT